MSQAPSSKAAHLVEAKPLTFVDHVVNIFHLVIKELRSIRADPTMLILVVYASFWQVLIQVLVGVVDVDPVAMDTARSYRLPRWRRVETDPPASGHGKILVDGQLSPCSRTSEFPLGGQVISVMTT